MEGLAKARAFVDDDFTKHDFSVMWRPSVLAIQ
jgi:hypothetical protein